MLPNRISLLIVGTFVSSLGLGIATAGCSSDDEPKDTSKETGSANDGGAEAASACTKDGEHLAEDSAAVCCTGLFKSCPSVSMAGDPTPCVCSTIECGTPTQQPPPNVNCCLGYAMHCETPIGGDQQCTCS